MPRNRTITLQITLEGNPRSKNWTIDLEETIKQELQEAGFTDASYHISSYKTNDIAKAE